MTAPVDPGADAEVQAAIAQLATREAELAFERERSIELRTARNYADSDAAGYIDRTGLEG